MIAVRNPAALAAAILAGLLAGGREGAAGRGPGPVVQSLVEREREFARAARGQGIREAFLEFLAADSVVFRPLPVSARKWYLDQKEMGGELSWRPTFAEVSGGGDLGYTSGPYRYRPGGSRSPDATYGHYISIWRKDSRGAWELVIDVGTEHRRPDRLEGSLSFREHPGSDSSSPAGAAGNRSALFDADDRFSGIAAADGQVEAFRSLAAEDIRLYRMDALPFTGLRSALRGVADERKYSALRPISADVSSSGDLGYTYGFADFRADPAAETVDVSGIYVRVWRRDPDGAWKIALDVVLPLPPGVPTSN